MSTKEVILTVRFENYSLEFAPADGEMFIRDEDNDLVATVKLEDLEKALDIFHKLGEDKDG